MVEALSVTTFVVGDRLPWPEDSSNAAETARPDELAGALGRRTTITTRKIAGAAYGGSRSTTTRDAFAGRASFSSLADCSRRARATLRALDMPAILSVKNQRICGSHGVDARLQPQFLGSCGQRSENR